GSADHVRVPHDPAPGVRAAPGSRAPGPARAADPARDRERVAGAPGAAAAGTNLDSLVLAGVPIIAAMPARGLALRGERPAAAAALIAEGRDAQPRRATVSTTLILRED